MPSIGDTVTIGDKTGTYVEAAPDHVSIQFQGTGVTTPVYLTVTPNTTLAYLLGLFQ